MTSTKLHIPRAENKRSFRNAGWWTALLLAAAMIWLIFDRNSDRAETAKVASALEVSAKQLRVERDALQKQLASVVTQGTGEMAVTLPPPTKEESVLEPWLAKVASLRKMIENTPGFNIPELQLVTAQDWLSVTQENKLESDADYRAAARKLRDIGKHKFSAFVVDALRAYRLAHGGKDPTQLQELLAYMPSPVNQAFFDRYQIQPSAVTGSPKGFAVVENGLVDPAGDSQYRITPKGFTSASVSPLRDALEQAKSEYRRANNNAQAKSARDVLPYFKDPSLRAQYDQILKDRSK